MDKLIVHEWGIHLIDVLRFYFGEITSVHAHLHKVSPLCRGEDRALVTPTMGDVAGLVDISWATIDQEKPSIVGEQMPIEGDEGTIELEALLPHWLEMERDLLAFKSGDRSVLLWNVLDSHQTRSYEQGLAVIEELLAMEGHEEMNAHFKWPSNW